MDAGLALDETHQKDYNPITADKECFVRCDECGVETAADIPFCHNLGAGLQNIVGSMSAAANF